MVDIIGEVILDKYRLTRMLGKGGYGEVYEAVHLTLDKKFAIKFTAPGADDVELKNSRKEARLLSGIKHKNVVEIIDYAIVEIKKISRAVIVMEYLHGTGLDDYLNRVAKSRESQFSWKWCDRFINDIGPALSYIHKKKIVHRDLKPSNIHVVDVPYDKTVILKIIDFGISGQKDVTATLANMDLAGFGTLPYMPPEVITAASNNVQMKEDTREHLRDIYAFGIILYEILAGRRAYEGGKSVLELAIQITTQSPPLLKSFPHLSQLPDEMERIVQKCIAADPQKRYQDIDHLLIDYRLMRQKEASKLLDVEIRDSSNSSHQERLHRWIPTLIIAMACFFALVWPFLRGNNESAQTIDSAEVIEPGIVITASNPASQKQQPGNFHFLKGNTLELLLTCRPNDLFRIEEIQLAPETGPLSNGLSVEWRNEVLPASNCIIQIDAALNYKELKSFPLVLLIKVSKTNHSSEVYEYRETVRIHLEEPEYWLPPVGPAGLGFRPVRASEFGRVDQRVIPLAIAATTPAGREIVFRYIPAYNFDIQRSTKPIYLMEFPVWNGLFLEYLQLHPDAFMAEHAQSILMAGGQPYEDRVPVKNLNLRQAFEFAQWMFGPCATIPTIHEWFVATGAYHNELIEGRSGPFSPEAKTLDEDHIDSFDISASIDKFPDDVSPFGIFLLGGNGFELTRNYRKYNSQDFSLLKKVNEKWEINTAPHYDVDIWIVGDGFNRLNYENIRRNSREYSLLASTDEKENGYSYDSNLTFRVAIVLGDTKLNSPLLSRGDMAFYVEAIEGE